MTGFAKTFKSMVAGFEKGAEKGPGGQRMRDAAQMNETMQATADGPRVTITMTGPIE